MASASAWCSVRVDVARESFAIGLDGGFDLFTRGKNGRGGAVLRNRPHERSRFAEGILEQSGAGLQYVALDLFEAKRLGILDRGQARIGAADRHAKILEIAFGGVELSRPLLTVGFVPIALPHGLLHSSGPRH